MENLNKMTSLDEYIQQQINQKLRPVGYITKEENQQFQHYFTYYLGGLVTISITSLLNGFLIYTISIYNVSKKIHDGIVIRLLKASFPKFYNLILKGRLMNRLSKDIFNVDINLPSAFLALTGGLFMFCQFGAYFILSKQYLLYPIFMVQGGISFFLIYTYMRSMREIARIEAVSKSPILASYTEIVRGAVYIRNCISRQFILESHSKKVQKDLRNQICYYGVFNWFIVSITCLNVSFIAIYMIAAYYSPEINSQNLSQFILIASNITASLVQFSVGWTNYQIYMINYERCLYLRDEVKIEQSEANQNYQQQNFQDEEEVKSNAEIEQEKRPTIIKFQNTSLQYRDNIPPAISNINIRIKQGQKIGIIGRTGAGKTSITLGLSRIIDICEGFLFLNGQDIRGYTLADLREQFSVIPQDPFVFQGTLRENLDPKNLYSDEELANALKTLGMSKCESFKQGLQSSISNLGSNLSAGEKQLVSIACALLKKTEIIMIDQASASMDQDTEELVMNAIEKSFINCTVLIIAHQIKTILQSDQIAVIDSGLVCEYDTPENLQNNPNSMFTSVLKAIEKSCGLYG